MLLLVLITIHLLLFPLTPLLAASLRLYSCYSGRPETWIPDRLATVHGDRKVMLFGFYLACMLKVVQSAKLRCISLVRVHRSLENPRWSMLYCNGAGDFQTRAGPEEDVMRRGCLASEVCWLEKTRSRGVPISVLLIFSPTSQGKID